MSRLCCLLVAAAACSGSSRDKPIEDPKPPHDPNAACSDADCLAQFRAFLYESPPDFDAANAFAREQCEKGSEIMCSRLGRLHAIPVWPGSDPAKALEGFEISCKRGYQRGCLGVGKVIMVHEKLGESAGGAKRALALFTAACDGGIGEACYYLGMFHYLGREVPKDPKKAVALLRRRADLLSKSCEAGEAWDCGLAAELYARGELFSDESFTPNPDPASAKKFATKGCELGHGGSCVTLGNELIDDPDRRQEAIDLFAKACELLDAEGCTALARHGAWPAERPRLFARACDLGGGIGCFAQADLMDQGGDRPAMQARARALQARGCALGYPPSCRYHANMVRAGHGGSKDEVAARNELLAVCQMIQRGTFCSDAECVRAMTASCAEAGEMMRRGEGGPVDQARGTALLKLACERGAEQACEETKKE